MKTEAQLPDGLDSNGKPVSDVERLTAMLLTELLQVNKSQLSYLVRIDRELNLKRTHKRFKFFRRKAK